jgi:predicted nuclease of predicted toxin-antitoxin system
MPPFSFFVTYHLAETRVIDEDFDNRILRGLLRYNSSLDIVRVQDVGLSGLDDPSILNWAAQEERILLTHDFKTMPQHVADALASGQNIAGVIVVPQSMPIGEAIQDIQLIAENCSPEEIKARMIVYLPL